MRIITVRFWQVLTAWFFVAFAILGTTNAQDHNDRKKHHLPETNRGYFYTCGYVERDAVPEYTWASEKAYEEFNDLKFGVRIHWGLYSVIRQSHESWPFLKLSPKEKQAYLDLAKTWNPQGFNADDWMDMFASAGCKMFAFTTKHHEGFSMYDTKTRVKKRVNWIAEGGPALEDCDVAYSIMEGPFKRDITKELCDAARKHNIKIDLYYSHNDWYDVDFRPYLTHPVQVPSTPTLDVMGKNLEPMKKDSRFGNFKPLMAPDPTPEEIDRMMKRHRDQLEELITNYGKVDMICLDGQFGPAVWPKLRETMIYLRKIRPDVMYRARGINSYGDFYTPEGFVPGSKENTQVPWFVIYPLGATFSYETDPAKHKGAKWIVQNIIDCAAKGGNFMVGIGPDENGKFHPSVLEQMTQTGKWLKTNGEGIYATRAREADSWKEADSIRYTRSKDNKIVYAHCYIFPEKQLVLKTVKAKEGSKIYMLGQPKTSLKWKNDPAKGLVITVPESLLKNVPVDEQLAFVFKIEI